MNKNQRIEAERLIEEVDLLYPRLMRLNIPVPNYRIAVFNLKSCVANLFRHNTDNTDLDWEIFTAHDIKLLQVRTAEYHRAIDADVALHRENSVNTEINDEVTAMFFFVLLRDFGFGPEDGKEFSKCIGSSRRKRRKVEADAAREQCLRSFEADSTARKTKLSYRLRRKIFPKDS